MNLRKLKKEVEALPNINQKLKDFRKSWPKSLDEHFSFVLELDKDKRKKIHRQFKAVSASARQLQRAHELHNVLQMQIHHLIDLKVSQLQQNQRKARHITNKLLKDDLLGVSTTIQEMQEIHEHTSKVYEQYEQVKAALLPKSTLDEQLLFDELGHQDHIKTIKNSVKEQKRITQAIGRAFVKLAKK